MISTLKNFLSPLKTFAETSEVMGWYLMSLAAESSKHTLGNASDLSGISTSQFSRLLARSVGTSELILSNLSANSVKTITKTETDLSSVFSKLPWECYVIVDSTPQKRSASKSRNVARFNLGGGFWFGHRWTNVVLFMNGHLIPLVPIPYRSKKECKRLGVQHKTEKELLCEYLDKLDLTKFVPGIKPENVAVLLDAGYDAKKVQNKILSKRWDLLSAIGKQRSIYIKHAHPSHYGTQKSEIGVVNAFQRFNRRVEKITCRLQKLHGQKKRKTFSVKRIHGSLKGVKDHEMVFLHSKTGRQEKVKYIACSRANLPTWKIVQAFSFRFMIEQFHKEIKQYFGFEEVASHRFDSVISHVNFVYSAYNLLNILYRDRKIGMQEKQKLFSELFRKEESLKIIQLSTRFKGTEQIRHYFNKKFSKLAA